MADISFLDKSPLLTTEHLTLRPFADTDLEDALSILYNSEIKETYMLPDFDSREAAVRLFNKLKDSSLSNEHFVYGAYLNDRLIGFLNDVELDGGSIEVGYVIHPSVKNNGYATEMLSAVIEELFKIGCHTVRAGFFEENHASRRVMEKSGMKLIDQTDDIEYRGKIHHCIFYAVSR